MKRALVLALLTGPALSAQVTINLVNGGAEAAAGAFYDFGKVAQGDAKDTRFRLRNPATGALTVSNVAATGLGFTVADRPSLPFVVAPGNFQDIVVRFTAGTPGNYSGSLTVNATTLGLQGTSAAAPVLSVLTGCTSSGSNAVDFGRIESGQTRPCSFSLRNPSALSMTIATLAVTGDGFKGPSDVAAPLTLTAGQTVNFTVTFTPGTAAVFVGALAVETRSYPLAGAAFYAPLGKPSLQFDQMLESAKQPRLSMALPVPASADASGLVTLTFTPDSRLVTDDLAIVFLATGGRTIGYSVRKGETQVLLGGQAAAAFQTGTVAGRLRFTLSSPPQGFASDPASELAIAAAPVLADRASAARRPGFVDLHIYGFDNTLSAGAVSFLIADASGAAVNGGSQSADVSADFRAYFAKAQAGGAFHLIVTFPVSGDASALRTVSATLSNSTGKSTQVSVVIP